MDKQSQRTLEAILKKDVSAITPGEKGILQARWKYVGKNSRKRFAPLFAKKK